MADRLLADKATLADECAKLSEKPSRWPRGEERRALERRASFRGELQRHRQKWDAERVAWEEEKTKQVKELTIRGLEPEIQRLVRRPRAGVAPRRTGSGPRWAAGPSSRLEVSRSRSTRATRR